MLNGWVKKELLIIVNSVAIIETRGILDAKMRIDKNWDPMMFPSVEDISHAKWLGKT